MKNYIIYENGVKIILENGKFFFLFFTADSGKVFYRYKIDTISNVKHPGIFIGVDENGQRWFMHNHYENGKPALDIEIKFSKNEPIYVLEGHYEYNWVQVIKRGLDVVMGGKPYSWFDYNCQTFINVVCKNKSKSEDVENWVGRIAVSLLVIGLIKSIK